MVIQRTVVSAFRQFFFFFNRVKWRPECVPADYFIVLFLMKGKACVRAELFFRRLVLNTFYD